MDGHDHPASVSTTLAGNEPRKNQQERNENCCSALWMNLRVSTAVITMTTFVGSEYLIAYGILKQIPNGETSVSFPELRKMARQLQDKLNELEIDAIVIDYELQKAITSYPDYFEFVKLNGVPYAKCNRRIGKLDLEKRFIGYLPLNILQVAMNIIKDIHV